jgi:hypothetical protein
LSSPPKTPWWLRSIATGFVPKEMADTELPEAIRQAVDGE